MVLFGTVHPIFHLKPMEGLRANMVSDVIEFSTNRANMVSDVIEFSTNQKMVNFFSVF